MADRYTKLRSSQLKNNSILIEDLANEAKEISIQYEIDGNGVAITPGTHGFKEVDSNMNISQVSVIGDAVGDIVIDIKKSSFAGFPTTSTIITDNGKADSGNTGHTVTYVATAQIDELNKNLGTGSLSLDGDSDYITIPDHDDFYFSTEIFTFECWVYLIDTGAGQYLYSHDLTTDPSRINLVLDMPVVGGLTRFQTTIKNAGVAETQNLTAGATITYNTWHHIAIVSDGTNIKHYVDGNLHTTLAIVPNSFINLDSDIIIGAHPANILHVHGNIDEVRISNVARYTSNFTPSTSKFTSDFNTKLLLHFDPAKKPTLSSEQKSQITSFNGWNTTLNKGDILEYVVDSVTTVKKCMISLSGIKQ